ncbi:MAG: hypothetical protein IT210_24960 [Armatimonadetes bacterium]|nr:hypothetical protein [Armatimonadota bacterium]
MREWSDEQTGRKVRQLTDLPNGTRVSYFRMPRNLPGGLTLAWGRHDTGNLLALEPETGEVMRLPLTVNHWLKLRETDGRLWCASGRRIWAVDLPGGVPEPVGDVPEEIPGDLADITCDGRTVILSEKIQDLDAYPVPTTRDLQSFWHYFSRPRTGRIWACDLLSGQAALLNESHEVCFDHQDTSPTDPGLLKFCEDMLDALGQRIWSVRVDGSALKKIRPQERFEFVTHEFWWPDGEHIGYTYQDRRGDDTLCTLPWGEYSPMPTRLGIARLDGTECYLSDPLSHYHSHLYVSPDGRWVCGEGTDGHSFAYAAPFSRDSARIGLVPLATIHTPYIPFRGQNVETGFTPDSRWLLYNDTVEGRMQVCAVRVDV